jgi:general secretion pathway protein J
MSASPACPLSACPPSVREDDPEAGTTLVELLVVLALMALIALVVGQGLDTVRRMSPLAGRIDAAAETALVHDHLMRSVGEALADLPLAGAAPFDGTQAAMRFLAPSDPVLEVDGIQRVTLSLAAAPNGLDLVETRGVARGDLAIDAALPGETRTVLLRGIRAARFAYADAPLEGEGEGEPDWRPEWHARGLSPALVRVEVEFLPKDSRRFAPLLIHPAASTAVADKRSRR